MNLLLEESEEIVLVDAILTFGEDKQVDKILEECTELSLAIIKYKADRNHVNYLRLIDEIADVKIMLAQSEIIFHKNLIDSRVEFKINRLKERLEEKCQK